MPSLTFHDVAVAYSTRRGQSVAALGPISLEVADEKFVCIVGPSGCGKSTLLRIGAGLVQPTRGKAQFDGFQIQGPHVDRGLVFQAYTLFHWLTVQQNVEFGLREKGVDPKERSVQARRRIESVGLTGSETAYPRELSGGMMQRAALARALANDPKLLLMDEPFGALDAQTRLVMQELLVGLWQEKPKTILFVTHDVEEALFLGDTIYVMSARPGTLLAQFAVPFSRPRLPSITMQAEFGAMKQEIIALIRTQMHV
jgi:NitT/TauT family transport system ATP-binding protein